MTTEEFFNSGKIRTYTGKHVDVFNPDPETILIEDIAHALANLPRWGGHLQKKYSVAQHCIYCAYLAPEKHKLEALLHDAAEAYLLDMPSPIKRQLPNYKQLEDNLLRVIADRFGIQYPFDPIIKQIDRDLLKMEYENIMLGEHCSPLKEDLFPHLTGREMFLIQFHSQTI